MTCTTIMLKAIVVEWNNEWTLELISWIEVHYDILSKITHKCKQQLPSIPNVEHIEDFLGLWAELLLLLILVFLVHIFPAQAPLI